MTTTATTTTRRAFGLTKPQAEEIRRIADRDGGLLSPEAVVEHARDPSSALHTRFEWDDTEAARCWRLEQARQLIRVHVEVVDGDAEPVRTYVSLRRDRVGANGQAPTYRALRDVMLDPQLRQELLTEAAADVRWLQSKFRALKQIASKFAEVGEAIEAERRR